MFDMHILITVLTAAVAALLTGSMWYHPRVFGRAWVRLVNISPEALEARKRKMPILILVAFIAVSCMAFVVTVTKVSVFILWAGLIVPALLGAVLWEGRSLKLFAINAGYWLIVLFVMSLIT